MPLISAGIGAAVGLAKTVTGAINNGKAKKEAKILEATRPIRETSPLIGQDLSLAESEASSGGISARAEKAYDNLNNQQFSASLGSILRGGGTVNNVADVFGANESGRQKLALLSDQLRMDKINNLTKARMNMAEEEDKNFLFNTVAPWRDKAQATAQARQQAQQDIWSGIDTVAGQAMGFAGQKYNEKMYDKYNPSGRLTDNSTYNPPPLMRANLPTTGASNMYAAPGLTPRTPNNNVYSYNWTPQQEQNDFQNDFGLIYQ